MHTKEKIVLTAATLVLSLGVALPAQAAATMCTDSAKMANGDMMAEEPMKEDAMMADDAMAKDEMATDDAMAGDEEMMADDSMAKDEGMMADDSMAKEGMMTADYTVKPGDSLWSIAETTLCDGNKYQTIVDANSDMLGGGMMIHPGQVLHIPGD